MTDEKKLVEHAEITSDKNNINDSASEETNLTVPPKRVIKPLDYTDRFVSRIFPLYIFVIR